MASAADPPDNERSAVERRLATILAADVAGYSRMMGEDEEATVQTLRGHRAIFDGLLRQHRGRVFNTAGDMILAEFPSAVEAVRCATEIQSALHTRNEQLPAGRKMLFRMGINLGDVVVQDGDLLGDGVNVAARIQTIAEPGGICISGSVYDQIQNKLSLRMRQLSDQTFKNIGQPIRTFTITDGESGPLPTKQSLSKRQGPRLGAAAAVVVLAVAAGGYWLYSDIAAKRLEQSKVIARLTAEKQAAEDARRVADEQAKRDAQAKSQAERERDADKREAAKREASQQAKAATTTPKAASPASAPSLASASVATAAHAAVAVAPSTKAAPAASSRYEGIYDGHVCNFPDDPNKKVCWFVRLKVENGIGTAAWLRRVTGKPVHLQAAIAPEGAVKLTLDGWNAKDEPLTGAMDGRVVDNHIDAAGRWANGIRMDGHWAHAN
jgi:class 3 adenylate cyclase